MNTTTVRVVGGLRAMAAVMVMAAGIGITTLVTPVTPVIPVTTSVYARQLQAPNRLDAVEHVDRSCPGLIRFDHDFTDAVATYLYLQDSRWGRNGKRGNPNDPSHDALAYRNPGSPFGVSIVDIIGGAGGPNPSVAWIDQTQATIDARTTGVWVAPSGKLPACLGGGGGGGTPAPGPGPGQPVTPAPPTPTPTPTPAPGPVDLGPVVAALGRIEQKVTDIEIRVHQLEARVTTYSTPPHQDLGRYIDAMIGPGPSPGGDVPNHITDIKQRIDALRDNLEQLDAWLRSRSVLRRF